MRVDDFANPGREHRMLQIIHGMGPHRERHADGLAGLARLLDERGYGGAVVNVDFSPQYLQSEAEWQTFLEGFAALRERGLRVWIYDEKGYPSLKAGGIVLRERPELEAMGLAMVRRDPAGDDEAALAADPELDPVPRAAVRVPLKHDGTPDFAGAEETAWPVAREDGWAYYTFHRRTMYEGTHCVTNYSDQGRYPNILDPEATAEFILVTHDAYEARMGERLGGVEALFTDEPSTMTVYLKASETARPVLPWSRTFEEEFQAREGTSPWTLLPAVFEEAGLDSLYARVRFWRTASALIEEHFYGQIEQWCAARGLASSGHALWEEHLYWQVGFEGDLYRALRRMHIPGIDILSSYPHDLARSTSVPIPKFLSSVAHLCGRTHCMSETSSHVQRMNKQPVTFEQRVGTINWQYVLGVNIITSYYGLDEMPPEDMRRFNDHIGRLGAVLTPGRHVADIALYYPIATAWAAFRPTRQAGRPPGEDSARVHQRFADACNALLRNQRDYDVVDDQALAEMEIADERLGLHGESFGCVVVPGAQVMPLETFRTLCTFAAAGGRLIFIEPAPAFGLTPEETEAIGGMWPGLLDAKQVARVPDAAAAVAALAEQLPADVTLDEPCEVLFYCRREPEPGRTLYFLVNCGEEPVERTLALRGEVSELWHPTTGERKPIEGRRHGEQTEVRLRLQAYEGVLLL